MAPRKDAANACLCRELIISQLLAGGGLCDVQTDLYIRSVKVLTANECVARRNLESRDCEPVTLCACLMDVCTRDYSVSSALATVPSLGIPTLAPRFIHSSFFPRSYVRYPTLPGESLLTPGF